MSIMKRAIGGSIHRIREFELEKVNLVDEFDILQIVGEGWFGKILLTEHRSTQTEMVLKALPKMYTAVSDFFREFHYGLHLSAHRNIITTYDVAFETAGFYVFSQEYAPLGDLTSNVTETGLGELHAKRVARQLAAAVHHIHSRELVHRDIKLDNILVFKSDFSRIKLCDFGETRRVNTVVRRHNEWLPYSPPEVLQIDTDETYKARTSHDVWQYGIVLFVCLTGCLPWQKAALDDRRYTRYLNWHNATLNIAKKPKLFQLISSRAQRMFKRLLDPKADKRPVSVLEVNKYVEDRWLAKLGAEKALNGGADERDELCPSMYSYHSSVEEKNQLLYTLTTYGIETTVDRTKKKDRIREWIQASAIAEENEDEESEIEPEARFDAEDDEEPRSMKGRHFPERRPSANVVETKRKSISHAIRKRQRQTARSQGRKNPFAPQVAAERETVARSANFIDGDPDRTMPTNVPVETANEPVDGANLDDVKSSVNGRNSRNSPGSVGSASVELASVGSAMNGNYNQPGIDRLNRNSPRKEDVVPSSPQVPSRRHRQQAPAYQGKADPPRAAHQPSNGRAGNGNGETSRPDGQSAGSLPPVRNNETTRRLENQSAPTVTTHKTLQGAVDGQTPLINPLTMPLVSHPTIPSFATIQNVNTSEQTGPSSEPSSATSSVASVNSRTTSGPVNAMRPQQKPNTPINRRKDKTGNGGVPTYGKDIYEHYGVIQGVIVRTESAKTRASNVNGVRPLSN